MPEEWLWSVRLRSRVVQPREPHSTGVTGEALKVMLEVGSDAIFAVWYFQEYLWDLSQWLKCQITHHGASIRSKMFTGKLDVMPLIDIMRGQTSELHKWKATIHWRKTSETGQWSFSIGFLVLAFKVLWCTIPVYDSQASSTCIDLSTSTSRSRAAICRLRLTYSAARIAANSRTMQMMRPADSHFQSPLQLFTNVHHVHSLGIHNANRFLPTALKSQAPASPASPACCSSTQQHHFSLFSIGSSTVNHDPPQIPSPTASFGGAETTWQVPCRRAMPISGMVQWWLLRIFSVTINDI